MIRLATVNDIPRIVEMGARFIRETGYAQKIAVNEAAMTSLVTQLITQAGGVLVAEEDGQVFGMLGYMLFPHPISGEKFGGEVFWWVEPEHRGCGMRLLLQAEKIAKAAGAVRMQMIAPTEKVEELYQRRGYEQVETTYQRQL